MPGGRIDAKTFTGALVEHRLSTSSCIDLPVCWWLAKIIVLGVGRIGLEFLFLNKLSELGIIDRQHTLDKP